MLSRTADHLFWLARYIERAENLARVLDVTHEMSLVPNSHLSESDLWMPALEITGNTDAFTEAYGELTAAKAIHYLSLDASNPSSIYSALKSARDNAHAVRAAVSSETWESINTIWIEFAQFSGSNLSKYGLHEFCDWVKSRSHLFRGVSFGTMLRDDAFRFLRLGTFIERADNTARLLDVKYHLLLPEDAEIGGAVDYYEWSAVLRSVSAFEAYQKVFNSTIEPWRVAELLVLRQDMPRSLHYCSAEVSQILEQLSHSRKMECNRVAGEIYSKFKYGKMEDIFQLGLHEFLTTFIESNQQLSAEIQSGFLNTAVVA